MGILRWFLVFLVLLPFIFGFSGQFQFFFFKLLGGFFLGFWQIIIIIIIIIIIVIIFIIIYFLDMSCLMFQSMELKKAKKHK